MADSHHGRWSARHPSYQPHRIPLCGCQRLRRPGRGTIGRSTLHSGHDPLGAVCGNGWWYGLDSRVSDGGVCGARRPAGISACRQFHGGTGWPADGKAHGARDRYARRTGSRESS